MEKNERKVYTAEELAEGFTFDVVASQVPMKVLGEACLIKANFPNGDEKQMKDAIYYIVFCAVMAANNSRDEKRIEEDIRRQEFEDKDR